MVEEKLKEETMVEEKMELSEVPLKTTHFVLVHGISHGAWCWYKIRRLMENFGYKVSCVDLKSVGIDQLDANSILSFDDYNKPLLDLLSTLPENEQVILVGHSAGGLNVTQATLKFPKNDRYSRRSKSMTSPMFGRLSGLSVFSSSCCYFLDCCYFLHCLVLSSAVQVVVEGSMSAPT